MIRKILKPLVLSVVGFLLVALGLVASQSKKDLEPAAGLDFEGVMAAGAFEPPKGASAFQGTKAAMRDGATLDITHVRTAELPDTAPLVVMVHGSGWHGGQFDQLAWNLRDLAEIKALTLRGHGADPIRRGDLDYIGQFEDDLADLVGDTTRPVVLLGHSSGGGLVIRAAGGPHGDLIDHAVLLAPYLHHTAPTFRENSGGWATPLLRRLIGLGMLNTVGIHALDHLTVMQFNMPKVILDGPQGHMATLAYTQRLNVSYAPRSDYLADVGKLPPFLLIAGAEDEAFFANQYEPTMAPANSAGQYMLLDGVGHLDVVNAAATTDAIRDLLRGLQ